MINTSLANFESFRYGLFALFPYRRSATFDLIDAVAAELSPSSIVKLSLSEFFRRGYSSITDVLSSLFRSDLKKIPTEEETSKQTLKITQFLAMECVPYLLKSKFSLFAIDCTNNPRIYSKKVQDRTTVHAPNHVPGQKPITVGHQYSVLVHIPDNTSDRELHWVIPLSTKRVKSNESSNHVGLAQLQEIATSTIFKKSFCVNVADSAYSTRTWVIGVSKFPNVVHVARMRGNRNVYRLPIAGTKKKRGRPLLYGEEIPLKAPSQPDFEELTTIVTKKGRTLQVQLARWNDVLAKGSDQERTHEHPFDLVRVIVTDMKGKQVYKRPLWLMITGEKRREITSIEAFLAYIQRYDIEHFFRFGKQRLHLINSQTCETRHEEGWHWIALLAYNMLYHSRQLAQATAYPWEKKKIKVVAPSQRPSQVQRDYSRIIRGIGTPASIPKPRGKSQGRQPGAKVACRPTCKLICKSKREKAFPLQPSIKERPKKTRKKPKKRISYNRLRRVWNKNRPAPMRC